MAIVFETLGGRAIAVVDVPASPRPVYLRDGDRFEFYVRDGNSTRGLDVRAAQTYVEDHWPRPIQFSRVELKAIFEEVIRSGGLPDTPDTAVSVAGVVPAATLENLEEQADLLESDSGRAAVAAGGGQGRAQVPPWLKIATRRVINLFLEQLASSRRWRRVYIVSPWISHIAGDAVIDFEMFARRLKEDGATLYLVTRPPEEEWHRAAIEYLGATGRANVALVPGLHAKLFAAETDEGAFVFLGSANFTQQSLSNRELGLLVNAYMDGRSVVRNLTLEASQIYRTPGDN